MKALIVSCILLYFLGTEAFENLTDCSIGRRKGICMTKSDCYAASIRSDECVDSICCLETRLSYRKCLEYDKSFSSMDSKQSRAQYRIIGGTAAKASEFPFMVAIGKMPESNSTDEHMWFCGGSIVSENFVITAAHCISKENARSYMVLAGTTSLDNSKAQLRYASEVIVHPKFVPWKMGYDLALIRVAEPFQLSANVFPLCLIDPFTLPTIAKGLAIGFGVEKEGVTKTLGSLMKVKLDLFSSKQCDEFYPAIVQYSGYKPSILCAGVAGGGKDTCQIISNYRFGRSEKVVIGGGSLNSKSYNEGDSGGPLTVPLMKPARQYGLFGVTSAGLSCGLSSSPGLYIKVPYFLSWLERNIWREEKKK